MRRLLLPLLLLPIAACSFLPQRAKDIRYAIWVTRWDYGTEADVRDVIKNCAKAGFDTVLFQVRGNGTVFYRSRIEPWAEQFDYRDPGFDPLWVACDEARMQGVQVHAWVNALPAWRGAEPPEYERHLFHTRPEWFMVDQDKRRQSLKADYYVVLNPCLPAVRDHIASVCEEIARKYGVAGVHLDYIRFLEPEAGHDYPYDYTTLRLYRDATGKAPADDVVAWDNWRSEQVTELVREIRRRLRVANRRCVLTAAVFSTPEKATSVHQDWVHWLRTGVVDAAFPMNYDTDDRRFLERIKIEAEAAHGMPIVVGIGVHKHADPAQTLRQMEMVKEAGMQGCSLFAYSSFFKPGPMAVKVEEASLRTTRRQRILRKVQGR